jgi:putative FmdB family regulatory protein
MPLFEYACRTCAHQFELLVRSSEVPACPACHGTALERKLSVFAAQRGLTAGPRTGVGPREPGPCGACGDPRGPGACSLN